MTIFSTITSHHCVLRTRNNTIIMISSRQLMVLNFFRLVINLRLPRALIILSQALKPTRINVNSNVTRIIRHRTMLIRHLQFRLSTRYQRKTTTSLRFTSTLRLQRTLQRSNQNRVMGLAFFRRIQDRQRRRSQHLQQISLLMNQRTTRPTQRRITQNISHHLRFPHHTISITIRIRLRGRPHQALTQTTTRNISPNSNTRKAFRQHNRNQNRRFQANAKRANLRRGRQRIRLQRQHRQRRARASATGRRSHRTRRRHHSQTLSREAKRIRNYSATSAIISLQPRHQPEQSGCG